MDSHVISDMVAEPSTIKDILGHSDIRMTDRYTHAVESRKRTALERLASFGKSAEVISLYERKPEIENPGHKSVTKKKRKLSWLPLIS